ncbi:MAG: S-layer homology domain-containing protein [Clostridia bacterium]|nr:S-layer homology domain-containing protein [Clostridia bacterium]
MATRFAVLNATDGKTFSDIAGHWGETYILKAATAGWIEGYPDGTFLPEKQITRAEAFAIINRVLVRSVDKAGIHKDATFWSDLEDKWYYCDVIEATNSHDYTRNADGKTETWTEMLPVPTWK